MDGASSGLDADTVQGVAATNIPRIASGTYSGNGASPRTISLSFTPKIVFILYPGTGGGFAVAIHASKGVILTDSDNIVDTDANHPLVTTNGFIVRTDGSNSIGTNTNGITYTYVAFGTLA